MKYKKEKVQLPENALRKSEDILGMADIPDNEHFYVSNDTTIGDIREALIEAYMNGVKRGIEYPTSSERLVNDYKNRKSLILNDDGEVIIAQG